MSYLDRIREHMKADREREAEQQRRAEQESEQDAQYMRYLAEEPIESMHKA